MKGFTNIPFKEIENVEDVIEGLQEEVKTAIDIASGQRLEDLRGVLSYLDPTKQHYSEGRYLGFDKTSFAVSEIQTVSKLPAEHRINYLLYRYRFNHYPRKGIVPQFPTVLLIEPASVCNLRCVMCFQADKTFSGDKKYMGIMDIKLFKKVIDEAVENECFSIVLASRGADLAQAVCRNGRLCQRKGNFGHQSQYKRHPADARTFTVASQSFWGFRCEYHRLFR